MSWSLKQKADRLLAEETRAIRKDWGGRVSFALVYPNTYAVGMSNLGFQTIYRHLNALPDVVCEPVFLPEPEAMEEPRRTSTPPFSLESMRPLSGVPRVAPSGSSGGTCIRVPRFRPGPATPRRPTAPRAGDP